MDQFKKLKEIQDSVIENKQKDIRHKELLNSSVNVSNSVISATESLIKYLNGKTTKTEVVNQLQSIKTPDAYAVVKSVNELHGTLKTHKNTDLSEVTKVMSDLLSEVKLIPKEHAEQKEVKVIDYTEQLKGLSDCVKAVEKCVKEQELVVKPPIVNVDAPIINVEPTDFKPLQASIKAVVSAVNKIVIPEYKNDYTGLEKLLKASNKLLKGILDKPISSGGGGGIVSYVNSSGIAQPVTLTAAGKIPVDAGVISTEQAENKVMGGPLEDTGYLYIGYKETDDTYLIKRQELTTTLWTYTYFDTDFSTNWTNRASLTYGEPI